MRLSAVGEEPAGFPGIDAMIDLKNDTSLCEVSYFDPRLRDTTYRLTKADMDSIRYFVSQLDTGKIKREYTVSMSDQPISTTVFYCTGEPITITDYGMKGDFPLNELYRLVYKPGSNYR